jgi:hypothetical protein
LAVTAAALALLAGCGGAVEALPGGEPSSATSRWTQIPAGPLSARHGAVGGWIGERFLLVGGDPGPACPAGASCAEPAAPPLADGAAFDPTSGNWQPIADAPRPVGGYTTAVVADDRLWARSSGHSKAGGVVLLSYDLGEDQWSEHPLPPGESSQLVTTGDTIVAVDTSDEHTRAVDAALDLGTDRWKQLPDDPLGPSFDRGSAWLGDRLLLTAKDLVPNPGSERPTLTRLAVLDRSLTRWTGLPDSAIIGGSPTPVAGRVVFPETGSADGGQVGNWGRPYPYGGIVDPATMTWTPLPEPPTAKSGLAGYLGSVGDRTLVGGHLLSPVTSEWTQLPRAPWPDDRTGQAVLTSPDSIFAWGGATTEASVAGGYLLRP